MPPKKRLTWPISYRNKRRTSTLSSRQAHLGASASPTRFFPTIRPVITLLSAAALLFAAGCNSNDSVKKAEKHVTLLIALSNKHKAALKNVTEKQGVQMTQAYPKEIHLDTATRMKPTLDAAR